MPRLCCRRPDQTLRELLPPSRQDARGAMRLHPGSGGATITGGVRTTRTNTDEGDGVNRGDPSTQVQVDARLLWRAVLADLQQSVAPAAFEWLRNTRLSDFAADVATVEVGDRVTAETLQRRFARDVERSLSERVGRPVTASFKAESGSAPATGEASAEDRTRPPDNGWDERGHGAKRRAQTSPAADRG